jgi:hypothetical protein
MLKSKPMSKLSLIAPAYAIATGNTVFASMQVSGENNMITVEIAGLNSADATVELHQSVDEGSWGVVPDSNKVLANGQTSHTWNVRGLVPGAFIRVGLTKGTATAGTINKIKLLSNG